MKKILMILACYMAFMVIPLTSYAAKDQTDTYEYEVRDGKAVLTRYATDSNATRVTVPNEVDGYEVIGLEGTFKENQRIEKITLPYGIEFLGDETFLKCRKLQDINLPDSISEIGFQCLAYTNIKSVNIPWKLTEIPNMAFADCESLISVNFDKSNIKSIGIYAFGKCPLLNSINLPDTLEFIGEAAFGYCDSIEKFVIPKNVKNIDLISWPIIYGKSLKSITNLSEIEWDRSVFEHSEDTYYNAWFNAENGYETVDSLLPNATIYRRKKDSSEKYVNKYSDIINQIIFSSKEYNSSSEILKKAKSLMPEIQIKTLSCEITLESFYPATDGSEYSPEGYAGSGCFKINASNNALENDKYVTYIWVSIEPQKYTENNPIQPGKPEEPDSPSEDPKNPGNQEAPGEPNNPEIPGNIDKPSGDNTTTDNENKPSSDGNTGNVGEENNNSGNAKPSGGSSGGSGGGSSSGGGGGRRSSGGSSSNNAPQGLLISKPSVIMGVWEPVDGRWKLKISDGSYASSQWASLDGKWYLFGADGYMLTSWQMVNNKWYFLGPDGNMLTGWQAVDGKWYWMEESGEMATGWKWIGDKCYYLNADGAMLSGTTTLDGYVVNENGEWIQ